MAALGATAARDPAGDLAAAIADGSDPGRTSRVYGWCGRLWPRLRKADPVAVGERLLAAVIDLRSHDAGAMHDLPPWPSWFPGLAWVEWASPTQPDGDDGVRWDALIDASPSGLDGRMSFVGLTPGAVGGVALDLPGLTARYDRHPPPMARSDGGGPAKPGRRQPVGLAERSFGGPLPTAETIDSAMTTTIEDALTMAAIGRCLDTLPSRAMRRHAVLGRVPLAYRFVELKL